MAHFAKIRKSDNIVVHVSGVDNWNIVVILSLNPIGYYLDGTTTMKQGNDMYNVPGIMYRKNGLPGAAFCCCSK